jgi:prepilin-type N-terminal cleavage/methylation domain-containing protein
MVGQSPKAARRGFTLVEIVIALVIVGFMLAAAIANFGTSNQSQSVGGVAQAFAAEIRSARSLAMASGWPTAIGIPSDGGTRSAATGFYQLEGPTSPRVTKRRSIKNEAPGVVFSVATWNKTSGEAWLASTPGHGPGFSPNSWSPPYPKDYLLVFLPSGRVLSNGWARDPRGYSFVVSNGIRVAGGSSPDGEPDFDVVPPAQQIVEATNPFTVTVSLDGAVSVQKGLVGGGVPESSGTGDSLIATLPPLTPKPTRPPELVNTEAFPKVPDAEEGSPAKVSVGGRLSLLVEAKSPDGVPLFARWKGPGRFSSAEPVPLQWSPEDDLWRGRLEWRPPDDTADGDSFELSVQVSDVFGLVNSEVGASSIQVTSSTSPWKVVYLKSGQLWLVDMDGASRQKISDEAFSDLETSPDGTQILAVKSGRLVLVQPGIGEVKALTPVGMNVTDPQWSGQRDRILFSSSNKVYTVRPDGSQLIELPLPNGGPSISPEGDKVTYQNWGIYTAAVDGSNQVRLTSHRGDFGPSISPDGSQIAFGRDHGPWIQILTMPASGGSPTAIVNRDEAPYARYTNSRLTWSPDGTKILFSTARRSSSGSSTDNVLVMDLAADRNIYLTDTPGMAYEGAVWSPDGTALLSKGQGGQLFLVEADDSARIELDSGGISAFKWVKG